MKHKILRKCYFLNFFETKYSVLEIQKSIAILQTFEKCKNKFTCCKIL